ncbi:MAG: metal-dependent hydrolase [Bacteroidia bacterium]
MDSLTHIVLGAAIGEAVLGKKIGRKAMLWGALADTIPDFDVFAAYCGTTPAQQLLVHRGITHSFFFILIMSPLLGWLWSKWFKKSEVPVKSWTWLFFLGMLTHILLDSLTSYGTGWFEPFSSYRVSFNTIFVADPFYTLPFLVCVLVALVAKNGSPKRTRWNKIGLWISCLYLVFTMVNKWHVYNVMKTSLDEFPRTPYDDFTVTPTALNNFLWMGYTHDGYGAQIGYYSIFDKTRDIQYVHHSRNDSLLSQFPEDESIRILKQFSKGQYLMTQDSSGVYFNDIRFGQMNGWDDPNSAFPFSYKLGRNSDNKTVLNRGKFKASFGDAFRSLYNRIKGR